MIKIYEVNKEQPALLDQLNKKKSRGTILIYSNDCTHCAAMKPQWEQMKQKLRKKPANIYEVNGEDLPYINHPIKNVVDGYPMILNVNNRNIVPFNEERTLDNMIQFVEKNMLLKDNDRTTMRTKRNTNKDNTTKKVRNSSNLHNTLIDGRKIINSLNLKDYVTKKRKTFKVRKIKNKKKNNKKKNNKKHTLKKIPRHKKK